MKNAFLPDLKRAFARPKRVFLPTGVTLEMDDREKDFSAQKYSFLRKD